jgi:hypothetical protein
MRRAQLSLSLVEASVGVLLLFAVTAGFFLAAPATDAPTTAQLDTYASDAGTVLTTAGDGGPRLGAALRSPDAFRSNRSALRERVATLLPANLLFRVETPHGAVGYPVPDGRPVGVSRVPTSAGVVTVRVWYA